VNPTVQAGWVHSRVLRAPWLDGQPAKLDCMLVHYVLPSAERGSLSFITPLSSEAAEDSVQRVSAIEALSPVLAGPGNLLSAARRALDIVLQATAGDLAELSLVNANVKALPEIVTRARGPRDSGSNAARRTEPPPTGSPVREESEIEPMAYPLGRERMYELVRFYEGALVTCEPNGAQAATWFVTIPLFAEHSLLAMLTVSSRQPAFSLASAVRALFVLGCQIGVFLRWAETRSRGERAGARSREAALQLHCFGQFRLVLDGQEIPKSRFRRHKSAVLLKVLAARRGKPWHREELMELLWPEAEPSLASSNLRVVLHELRHVLEPGLSKGRTSRWVVGEGDLIYLDPSDNCWCDVEEFSLQVQAFEAHLGQDELEEALGTGRAACDLYAADLLEDEPYLEWCLEERERLREVYVNLLRRMAAMYAQRNELDAAMAACRQALAADAMREEMHRQLMQLLWQAGRPDEALRQYESCRKMLQAEFGAAPSQGTQRLRAAILAGLSTEASPTPVTL
ncbi:MAG: winged helix-turn-helix domain-containing protein, partial [Chloroflexota bacterium]|nr:winged helix-turn-helix domain-containing protein [Chloroflexota bacterium]